MDEAMLLLLLDKDQFFAAIPGTVLRLNFIAPVADNNNDLLNLLKRGCAGEAVFNKMFAANKNHALVLFLGNRTQARTSSRRENYCLHKRIRN